MPRTKQLRRALSAVADVLSGAPLTAALASEWLAGDAAGDPGFEEALRDAAGRRTRERWNRRIALFAPLYYSNLCVNDCSYCGFRRENRNARRRVLTPDEIEEEAACLLGMGHRRILLVASEDPSDRGRALLLEAARRVRSVRRNGAAVAHVGMEVAPGDVAAFRAMAEAGVDSYTLFQETYDRSLYASVHRAGPKTDFDRRRDAPHRAREGGIPDVSLGVLFGLGDPAFEVPALIEHAREIESVWGRPPRTVSVPRMEPADGSDLSSHPLRPVSDGEMLRVLAILRLALPATGVVLSTRESRAFRERALDWGVTEMSAGSRTDPGGYAHEDPGGSLAQFSLQDDRSLEELAAALRARGYEPWTGAGSDLPGEAGRGSREAA